MLTLGSVNGFAQIGIGTKTPAPSAALEVSSLANNKGILIPRLTATQKDAIVSPAEGLLVYQTTTPIGFYYYSNTVWKLIIDQTDLDNKLASAKTYVDDKIAATTIADATTTTKGKIQLAGDLGGTADAPTVPGLALKANTSNMTTALASKANISSLSTVATSGNYNDLANKPNIPSAYVIPKASVSELGGVKIGANLSIDANGVLSAAASGNSASTLTGVVPVANGGTGTTSIAGIKSLLGFSSPSVAIGDQAGKTNQGSSTVGVGGGAGATNQGGGSVAVGYVAGYQNQGGASVAIGSNAAQSNQGTQAVALGFAAGQNGQGAYSVAVGSFAGNVQAANSIALNATGASLNPTTTGFFVDPIINRPVTSTALYYNTTTKEITSGTAASSGVPYTGATGAVNLGNYDLTVNGITAGMGSGNLGFNTVFGRGALSSTALTNGGNYNLATGYVALQSNTTGSFNTATGTYSLLKNTTGNNNTGYGVSSLFNNTSGNNNTAIGYGADVVSNNLSNATAIGYDAKVAADNTIQLGNTAVANVKTSGTLTAGTVTYPNTNGTAGQVLTSNTNGNASWTTIASVADASTMTGTAAIANGGTGATTKTTAFDALSPMTTAGDIIYGGTNGAGTRLAKGNNFSFLTLDNAGLPTWTNAIRATSGSTWNAAMGFSFIGGDWAKNTGMFSDNPDDGNAMLKFRITGNSKLTIDPNNVAVLANTASTSKTTGALTVAGGLGVTGDLFATNVNTSGTLTAGTVTYPNAHNSTAGQLLSINASGTATWATPASSGGTHAVGEAYGGGIVFYTWDGGAHGLVAATANLTGKYWGADGTQVNSSVYPLRDGIGAGRNNTERIIQNIKSSDILYKSDYTSYAAYVCLTFQDGNYGDWYLPSKYELSLLYLQKTLLGMSGMYWSSNDGATRDAWCYNFDAGTTYLNTKNYFQMNVRPIRSF